MIKKLYAEGGAALDKPTKGTTEPIQTKVAVKNVASLISRIIGSTLGPGGRNWLTDEGITNDGVSILKQIDFDDEREASIRDVFEEIALRQDNDAGDGTTTATLLGCALTPLVLEDVVNIDTPTPGS